MEKYLFFSVDAILMYRQKSFIFDIYLEYLKHLMKQDEAERLEVNEVNLGSISFLFLHAY